MKLRQTQNTIAAALMQPRPESTAKATALLRPNSLLTARERFDIYRRSYWARVLDSLSDDFPGLRAILGARAFTRLARAYLLANPSRSFTLRDLGARLETWLEGHPNAAGPNHLFALDMVRLEWAHILAFDGPSAAVPGPDDLLAPNVTLGLQPYISLLNLQYPVDALRLRAPGNKRKITPPKPEAIWLAVHRVDCVVHYKRLRIDEYFLLQALQRRQSLPRAIHSAIGKNTSPAALQSIETSFATWARLGWLTVPPSENGD